MKFSELYSKLIEAWPVEILISDAKPASETGSQYFPTFSQINEDIEDQIDYATSHWENLGQSALAVAFWEESKALYQQGVHILNTRLVSKERINFWVVKKLHAEGWENELNEYEQYPA